MRMKAVVGLAVALLLTGCDDFPKDAVGTLDRVRASQVVKVGAVHNPPWVVVSDGQVGGVEPALAARWASELGVRIEFVPGPEEELVNALYERELDVLLAGFKRQTPHSSKLALSQPYLTTRTFLAVAPGQTPPAEWEGHRVAVAQDRLALVGRIREMDAVPVPPDGTDPPPAMAGYEFEIRERGFETVGRELQTEERVMAVVPGESALLLSLDVFLNEQNEEAIRAMAAEVAP